MDRELGERTERTERGGAGGERGGRRSTRFSNVVVDALVRNREHNSDGRETAENATRQWEEQAARLMLQCLPRTCGTRAELNLWLRQLSYLLTLSLFCLSCLLSPSPSLRLSVRTGRDEDCEARA